MTSETKIVQTSTYPHELVGDDTYDIDSHDNVLIDFDAKAERRLRWKIDCCTLPVVSLLYLFAYIDRANIGNARIAGLDADLKLGQHGYNKILSVFYVAYIVFELPSTIACKYFGPGWFIPFTTLCFGFLSLATAWVHDLGSACAVRFLLGAFESGILPGIAYYLSRWYRRSELTFRLALYTVMAPLSGAFGGLLASAILTMEQFAGFHRWRVIFAVEGIVTIAISVLAFALMTDRPETARWLSQKEKGLAVARLRSERIGTVKILDTMDMPKVKRGIFSPVTLSVSLIFFFNNITAAGVSFFAPTIVKSIFPKASVVSQQLHTVPPYVVGVVFVLMIPYLSWKTDKRNIYMILAAPISLIGYIVFLASEDRHVRYGATFLVTSSAFCFGALTISQVSANVVSDTARAAAVSTNVMIGNLGGLVATWSYLPSDAPNFHIGNGLNIAACSGIIITATLLMFWMSSDNPRKDHMKSEEKLRNLDQKQVEDLDWTHPEHRWKS